MYTWGHGDGGRLGHGDGAQCPLPTPVKALDMMSLAPQEVHCGDKFTVVLVKPSVDGTASTQTKFSRRQIGSSVTGGALIRYSKAWFREELRNFREVVCSCEDNDCSRVHGSDKEKINAEHSVSVGTEKLLNGSHASQLLLSLIATECDVSDRRTTDDVNHSDIYSSGLPVNVLTDKVFAVECSTPTFAHILCLLEMNAEALCLSIDSLICSDQRHDTGHSLNTSPSPSSPAVSMIGSIGASQTFAFDLQNTKKFAWFEGNEGELEGSRGLLAAASILQSLLSVLNVNLLALSKVVVACSSSKNAVTGKTDSTITENLREISSKPSAVGRKDGLSHHTFGGFSRRYLDSSANGEVAYGANSESLESRFYEGRDDEGASEDGMEYSSEDSEDEEVVAYENMDIYTDHGFRSRAGGAYGADNGTADDGYFDFGNSDAEKTRSGELDIEGGAEERAVQDFGGNDGDDSVDLQHVHNEQHLQRQQQRQQSDHNEYRNDHQQQQDQLSKQIMDTGGDNSPVAAQACRSPSPNSALEVGGDEMTMIKRDLIKSDDPAELVRSPSNAAQISVDGADNGASEYLHAQGEFSGDISVTNTAYETIQQQGDGEFVPRYSPNPSNESLASNESFEDLAEYNNYSYFQQLEEEDEGDMMELQTALVRSMEDMASDSAYEEYSLPLRTCLREPHIILPRIREALEAIALKAFSALDIYDGFPNYFQGVPCAPGFISQASATDAVLALSSLWLELQRAIGNSFSVLYLFSHRQILLEKMLHQPGTQLPLLPGLVEGLCCRSNDFKMIRLFDLNALDTVSAFAFVQQKFLAGKARIVVDEYLDTLIDHTAVDDAFLRKQQIYRCHELISTSYYQFLRLVLAAVLSGYMEPDASADLNWTAGDVDGVLSIVVQCISEELPWICRCELADVHANEKIQDILNSSLTSYFLPFLGSFFASHRGVRSVSMFMPHACRLLSQFKNHYTRLSLQRPSIMSVNNMIELTMFLERKFKWIYLFMAASVQILCYPKLILPDSKPPNLVEIHRLVNTRKLLGTQRHALSEDTSHLCEATEKIFHNYAFVNTEFNQNFSLEHRPDETSTCCEIDQASVLQNYVSDIFRFLRRLASTSNLKSIFEVSWWPEMMQSLIERNEIFGSYFHSLVGLGAGCEDVCNGIVALHQHLFLICFKAQGRDVSCLTKLSSLCDSQQVLEQEPLAVLLISWVWSIGLAGLALSMIKIQDKRAGDDLWTQKCDLASQIWGMPLTPLKLLDDSVLVTSLTALTATDVEPAQVASAKDAVIRFFTKIVSAIEYAQSASANVLTQELALLGCYSPSAAKCDSESAQSFSAELLAVLANYTSVHQLVAAAMQQEVVNRSRIAGLLLCALGLQSSLCSPNIQMYFSESIVSEFEGNENILDWIRLPSWSDEMSNSTLAVFLENKVSDECNNWLCYAFNEFDDAVRVAAQCIQLESTEGAEENLALLFHLVDYLRLGWHCYCNFTFAVFPSVRLRWEPISALEIVSKFVGLSCRADIVSQAKCNRSIQLLESCLTVIEMSYRCRKSPDRLSSILELSAISSIMELLISMLLSRVGKYQTLLGIARECNMTFLLPCTKDLLSTSPTIIPSVFSPRGQFCIGFWIKVSRNVMRTKYPAKKTLHVISRVPETSDFNLLALVSNEGENTCNPKIFLELDDGGYRVVAVITVKTPLSTSAQNGAKATLATVKISSSYLSFDEWNLVSVHHTQRAEEELVIKTSGGRTKRKVARKEHCCVSMFINGAREQEAVFLGGLFQPYQTVIIGTVPTVLEPTGSKNIPSKEGVLLSGVFWLSSSSAGLEENGGSPKNINLAVYDILNQGPPTVLQEEIMDLWAASTKLLDVASGVMGVLTSNSADTAASTVEAELKHMNSLLLSGYGMICLGDERVLDSSLRALDAMLKFVRKLDTAGGDATTTSLRAVEKCLIAHLIVLIADMSNPGSGSGKIMGMNDAADVLAAFRAIWKKRLQSHKKSNKKSAQEQSLEANLKFFLNENMLISGVAAIASSGIINSSLFCADSVVDDLIKEGGIHDQTDESSFKKAFRLLCCLCGGGWPAMASINRTVEVIPRALFLNADPKGLEQVLFPTCAVIMHVSQSRPGIWLRSCVGSFTRAADSCGTSFLIPRSPLTILPSTEMITTRDPCRLATLRALEDYLSPVVCPDIEGLSNILRDIVCVPATHSPGRQGIFSDDCSSSSNGLIQLMSFLRSLLCQLTILQHLTPEEKTIQLDCLSRLLQRNIRNIATIAATDPVMAVTRAFDSSSYKGAQLDVLRNLLKEGDVCFLEKISLRVWRDAKGNTIAEETPHRSNDVIDELSLNMIAVAGDVQIIGSRIRAIAHFPTVKLAGISLDKMTGRWFYECTLLSDGLLQIGWASPLFRCDPSCGQGTGDHVNSWAFDGLRSKKWNVSCESYGKRWRQGDVIGVLVDMDLLEMRYFINGEDLGAAFVNFTTSELFPALSLNVRQAIRVNFGQYKFVHPPDEYDGKKYRSIKDYLIMQTSKSQGIVAENGAVSSMNSEMADGIRAGCTAHSSDVHHVVADATAEAGANTLSPSPITAPGTTDSTTREMLGRMDTDVVRQEVTIFRKFLAYPSVLFCFRVDRHGATMIKNLIAMVMATTTVLMKTRMKMMLTTKKTMTTMEMTTMMRTALVRAFTILPVKSV
jgi:hypothetical protein